MTISKTYIQYGVSNEIAIGLEEKNLPISTLKRTSIKNLVSKYDIDSTVAEFVKNCIKREPVNEEIIQKLLENSNFTCCLCKGKKSDAFIIHHIVHYSKTHDNSYENLAVLCPNDHDLAHREGIALTYKITEKQIRKAKANWEKQIRENNLQKSIQSKSELDSMDMSKVEFESRQLSDAHNIEINYNYFITPDTRFILIVDQTSKDQEFVTYVSFKTDQGDQKWIGFGTALELGNNYPTERIYRVGRPGKKHYEFLEYIWERINESGLIIKGKPILINQIKLWGWHNNTKTIKFKLALID